MVHWERVTSLVDTGSRTRGNEVEAEIRPFLNGVKLRAKCGARDDVGSRRRTPGSDEASEPLDYL